MEEVSPILDAIAQLRREIEKAFENLLVNFPATSQIFKTFEPPYDLEDRGDVYVVRIDLPGFKKDEIKVKVAEDRIEVIAEKSEEKKAEDKSRNYIVRQRVYERMYRVIRLPEKIIPTPERIKARLEDGVLELELPKAGVTREVEIKLE